MESEHRLSALGRRTAQTIDHDHQADVDAELRIANSQAIRGEPVSDHRFEVAAKRAIRSRRLLKVHGLAPVLP